MESIGEGCLFRGDDCVQIVVGWEGTTGRHGHAKGRTGDKLILGSSMEIDQYLQKCQKLY